MGIKGVYGEIGPGTRTSLSQLAVKKREEGTRSLRIAVDISIWQYQIQLGKGGTNADLRTLFYRLIRLLRFSIEPLFVFDGPHKPPFKRDKKTSSSGGSAFKPGATRLFDLFGFPYITAPGEAEAECALLQREGIVDAVLSEDVDTLMFGCNTSMRNWGTEFPKGSGPPTHVDVYHAHEIKAGKSGLDRAGMVLIALMSGGDYMPAGIPNCGIKTACEAARAEFGEDLFKIDRKDARGFQAWRDRLQHELQTNESKFFRTKHQNFQVPEKFPDKAVLYYYKHPVVSTSQQVEIYRKSLTWGKPDIPNLRRETKTLFDWYGQHGLCFFIKQLAPAMLAYTLSRGNDCGSLSENTEVQTAEEGKLVKLIYGRRLHPSSGNEPELRVGYVPQDIVGLSLSGEAAEELLVPQTHTAVYSSDEEDHTVHDSIAESDAATKKRTVTVYDPTKIERDWFPETYVKLGVPLLLKQYLSDELDPKKFATRKARAKRKEKEVIPSESIERYLYVTKPGIEALSSTVAVQGKSIITPRKPNVSSHPILSVDDNLTDLVPPKSKAISPTKRKTVSRSHHTVAKASAAGPKIADYARVTKPKSEIVKEPLPPPMKSTKDDPLDMPSFIEPPVSNKHGRSSSPIQSVNKYGRLQLTTVREEDSPTRARKKSSLIDFWSPPSTQTISEMTCQSVNHAHAPVKRPHQRSPFSRTISAPTKAPVFMARPLTNAWKSIDDFDVSFETPERAKAKATDFVDLTLT